MEDVTGNGYVDFIYSYSLNQEIMVLEGQADGTFDTERPIVTNMRGVEGSWTGGTSGTGSGNNSTFLADVDGDGNLDWVHGRYNGAWPGELKVFLGDGKGGFSNEPAQWQELPPGFWAISGTAHLTRVGSTSDTEDAGAMSTMQAPEPSAQSGTEFVSADDGDGLDTLKLSGEGIHLDFVSGDGVAGLDGAIEMVDLTGSGANVLTIGIDDVLDLSKEGGMLLVTGDGDDTVNLAGFVDTGKVETIDETSYSVYIADGGELWLDQEIGSVNAV